MVIERSNSEIIIKIPSTVNVDDLQDLINHTRYKELSSTFQINQNEIDKLESDVNANWWKENKQQFIK
jgi:hypothetical protein